MDKKIKNTSDILKAVHETAVDLHKIGFIDKRKMNKYDALCINPIPRYSPTQIKRIRLSNHLSQSALASLLNTSLPAVRQWESGNKNPSGTSLKLINLLERKGLEVFI